MENISVYEKMLERLKKVHDEWVEQNHKINGLWHAIEQVHPDGDIKTDYAVEVLRREYEEMKKKNEKTRSEMYAREKFIEEFERDMDIKSDKIKEIFGY